MNDYTKQANDFLQKAGASMTIDYQGLCVNKDWRESKPRNLYRVTLKTPRGIMTFDFWDSLHNTELYQMTFEQYAIKKYRRMVQSFTYSEGVKIKKEYLLTKEEARPTSYDVLACLTKYDVGTFEDFCAEFGFNEDSRSAERIYIAVIREYKELTRIFTAEQMDELREIN